MNVRVFAIVVAAIVFATAPAAQLPAISWTCPMHPDVLEAKEGACSICGMDLVAGPARPRVYLSGPRCHRAAEAGQMPDLLARPRAEDGRADVHMRRQPRCVANRAREMRGWIGDGAALLRRARTAITTRSTADCSSWRRTTGITSRAPIRLAGRFRVYVYDDFSKPLSVAQARKVRGRVVTKEAFDPKTGTTRELASTPLVLARNGAFFEARIEPLALPAKLTAKISFTSDDKESRFDFAFPAYSRDVPPAAPASQTRSTPQRQTLRLTRRWPSLRRSPDSLLERFESAKRRSRVAAEERSLGRLYVPALQAKDLALEIQAKQPAAHQEAHRSQRQADRARRLSARQLRRSRRRREGAGSLSQL